MLTGSMCIASKTRAKMNTLQAVAPDSSFHGRVDAVATVTERRGGCCPSFQGH
jgi:hypothetical protein